MSVHFLWPLCLHTTHVDCLTVLGVRDIKMGFSGPKPRQGQAPSGGAQTEPASWLQLLELHSVAHGSLLRL